MRVKIKEIDGEFIYFTHDRMMCSHHSQSCCEWHYLDCDTLEDYTIGSHTGERINIYEQEFEWEDGRGIGFIRVPGDGINIYDVEGNIYFIPGRGNNNGYYSDNLTLEFHENGKIVAEYDIADCQAWEPPF